MRNTDGGSKNDATRQAMINDAVHRIHWNFNRNIDAYEQETEARTNSIIVELLEELDPPKRPIRAL